MDLANKVPKIKDQEKESKFGYVFAVSGPGRFVIRLSNSQAHLICIAIHQLFLSYLLLHINQSYLFCIL